MEQEPITIFKQEEENAFKRLSEIQNLIGDGILELDRVKKSLETAYEERARIDKKVFDEILTNSKHIIDEINGNYQKITAYNAISQETFDAVKRLTSGMERACRTYEIKSQQLEETYQTRLKEINSQKERLKREGMRLEERAKGLEAFQKHLLKMAAQVDSRVEALKALK
jgi:chromosome segregation ATPase